MPRIIDFSSTGICQPSRLENESKQIYGIFSIFLLAVIGSCDGTKHPHIFLTRANQYIQEINKNLYGTLNNFWYHDIFVNPGTKLILHFQ